MIYQLYRSYSIGLGNYEIIVHEELRRMWKEVVMTYFKITVQHLLGRLRKIMKPLSQVKYQSQDCLNIYRSANHYTVIFNNKLVKTYFLVKF
jgi:hypothetical protein